MNIQKWTAVLLAVMLCFCTAVQAFADYRTLQEGDSGEDVLQLKKAMYDLGYFHSLNLTDLYNDTMTERIRDLQRMNGLEETGLADSSLQALIFSGDAVPKMGTPLPTPVPTLVVPQGTPSVPSDAIFLKPGEAEFVFEDENDGLWLYKSDALSVEIRRKQDLQEKLVWYETDIYTSDRAPMTSYLSVDEKDRPRYENPIDFARKHQMVLGISDDFFGIRLDKHMTPGIVIRNGQVQADHTDPNRNQFPDLSVLAVFKDGSMKTFACDAHTAEEYIRMGAVHTFAFGPILVTDGKMSEKAEKNKYYHYREPRCAIGMIEPHHYLILTVKGRCEQSRGVYFKWLAEKMLEKGVVEAINLDGGKTTALIFMGKPINAKGTKWRKVTSMIGFGVSQQASQAEKEE